MIVGLGTDLVSVARLEESLARTPTLRERLFTPAERELPVESLAARFAAKEALAKALGAPPGLGWQDAEVVGTPPRFELSGAVAEAVGTARVHLSLSHDAGMAVAVVLLESQLA